MAEENKFSRLDNLILENAKKVSGMDIADIAIFADPDLSLTQWAIALLQEDSQRRLFVGARDVLQAFATLDLADEAEVTDRVFIAGYQNEIQLDIFFSDAASGFGGVIEPAQISLALTHLPKALEELRYFVKSVALAALPDSSFLAGGNNKYLTRSQNEVFAEVFGKVYASLGSGKFRCLIAENLREDISLGYQVPVSEQEFLGEKSADSSYFQLVGVGGVFSGAKPDRGGEFLVQTALPDLHTIFSPLSDSEVATLKSNAGRDGAEPLFKVLDLGCGNGLILKNILRDFPDAFGYGSDISADAICSAHMTLLPEILAKRVKFKWDDAARSIPAEEIDVVFLNPPFHQGTAVDATLVQRLISGALKTLKSGGVLYLVHNSHLRYRPLLEQGDFAQVNQLGRNQKFTVLKAVKK
ncbi:MAG: methyltransferase [Arcanobacterium sp.]|nr:methyltransferase [Arcanobacterium sp.]